MQNAVSLDTSAPSRQLVRILRSQPDGLVRQGEGMLPESVLWNTFCELRRRGEPEVDAMFLRSVKTLHRRRAIGGADLPTADVNVNEHKLVDDPFLGELWKAYKKCICRARTGPAAQLLRDIEAQLLKH